MSKNYILSLNHNELNTVSRKLKDSSENFKELSSEIKSLYRKLDWQTASKANVYEHVRRASESALRIYSFLNDASKAVDKISRNFNSADRDAANFVSKEVSNIRKLIRSSGIKTPGSNAFTNFINNLSKLFFGDNRYGAIPVSSIPKNPKYFAASIAATDDKSDFGFNWANLGVNPFKFSEAESNIINFYLSSSVLATITAIQRRAFSRTFQFAKLGVSIVKFTDSGSIYYLITGKQRALRDLGVTLPANKRYGIAQGAGVPDEVVRRIRLSSDQLKSGLRAANDRYRLRLRDFRRANANLPNNSALLKQTKFQLTVETLEDLRRTLGPLEAELVRARLKAVNAAKADSRLILSDLNKNLKAQAVMKEIDSALLDNLPRIDTLNRLDGLRSVIRGAGTQLIQDLKLINPWVMLKGIKTEVTAIKGAGGFLKGVSKFCKSSAILTAIGIGIDIFFDVTDDTKRTEEKVAAVFVDIAFGVATAAASAFLTSVVLGAAFGTCIPIPIVGTIVGAVVGAVIGLAIVLVTEVLTINGKSIKDWAKEGVTAAVDFTVDIATDVGEGISNAYNATTDAISTGWDNTTSFISSGWNSLFGGGDKSGKAHASPPPKEAYENQTGDLQSSYAAPSSGTNVNLGNNFQYRFSFS